MSKSKEEAMLVPGHNSRILSQLHQLQKDKQLCDLVLACTGGQVMAHKIVFMAASPFFRANRTMNASHVFLRGASKPELECIVDYIYTGKLEMTSETDVNILMRICEELQLQEVIQCYNDMKSTEKTNKTPAAKKGRPPKTPQGPAGKTPQGPTGKTPQGPTGKTPQRSAGKTPQSQNKKDSVKSTPGRTLRSSAESETPVRGAKTPRTQTRSGQVLQKPGSASKQTPQSKSSGKKGAKNKTDDESGKGSLKVDVEKLSDRKINALKKDLKSGVQSDKPAKTPLGKKGKGKMFQGVKSTPTNLPSGKKATRSTPASGVSNTATPKSQAASITPGKRRRSAPKWKEDSDWTTEEDQSSFDLDPEFVPSPGMETLANSASVDAGESRYSGRKRKAPRRWDDIDWDIDAKARVKKEFKTEAKKTPEPRKPPVKKMKIEKVVSEKGKTVLVEETMEMYAEDEEDIEMKEEMDDDDDDDLGGGEDTKHESGEVDKIEKRADSTATEDEKENNNASASSSEDGLERKKYIEYACEECELTFAEEDSLTVHSETHKKAREGKACRVCFKEFNKKMALAIHEHTKHAVPYDEEVYKVYRCKRENCSYITIDRFKFNRHLSVCGSPTKVRRFDCEKCGKRFKTSEALEDHDQGVHVDKLLECELCNAKYKKQISLEQHMKHKHIQEKKYQCHLCPRMFFLNAELDRHLFQKHDVPLTQKYKTYNCEKCEYVAFSEYGLKIHQQSHQDMRNYKCIVCHKSYKTESALKSHMRSHRDRTFKCEFIDCQYETTTRAAVKHHMLKKHPKEDEFRPYGCSMCDYQTSFKANLDKHLREVHRILVIKRKAAAKKTSLDGVKKKKKEVKKSDEESEPSPEIPEMTVETPESESPVDAFHMPEEQEPLAEITTPELTSTMPEIASHEPAAAMTGSKVTKMGTQVITGKIKDGKIVLEKQARVPTAGSRYVYRPTAEPHKQLEALPSLEEKKQPQVVYRLVKTKKDGVEGRGEKISIRPTTSGLSRLQTQGVVQKLKQDVQQIKPLGQQTTASLKKLKHTPQQTQTPSSFYDNNSRPLTEKDFLSIEEESEATSQVVQSQYTSTSTRPVNPVTPLVTHTARPYKSLLTNTTGARSLLDTSKVRAALKQPTKTIVRVPVTSIQSEASVAAQLLQSSDVAYKATSEPAAPKVVTYQQPKKDTTTVYQQQTVVKKDEPVYVTADGHTILSSDGQYILGADGQQLLMADGQPLAAADVQGYVTSDGQTVMTTEGEGETVLQSGPSVYTEGSQIITTSGGDTIIYTDGQSGLDVTEQNAVTAGGQTMVTADGQTVIYTDGSQVLPGASGNVSETVVTQGTETYVIETQDVDAANVGESAAITTETAVPLSDELLQAIMASGQNVIVVQEGGAGNVLETADLIQSAIGDGGRASQSLGAITALLAAGQQLEQQENPQGQL